jgi:branched-chain amino acid transport system substrate-binding protein
MQACRLGAIPMIIVVAVGVSGCGGGDPQPAGDAELRVHVSLPLNGPFAHDGRDALDGARLALAEAGGEAGGVAVVLEPRDDTAGKDRGALPSPVAAAANARAASEDSTAIAYVGDLLSGATGASLPITNEARMLQVSPGAGAPDLVSEVSGGDDPGPLQPTGERTFGRIVPSDTLQAGAAAQWTLDAGAEVASVGDDGSRYGRELAGDFRSAASEMGLRVGPSPGQDGAARPPQPGRALFFATEGDQTGIAPALAAAQGARAETLVLPDAALGPGYLAGAPAAELSPRLGAPEVLAVAATLAPGHLPDGGEFTSAFREEFHRAPGRYSAYGYEAMALVLDAIDRASDPTDRQAVVDAFFAQNERDGALGTYTITELGETTLDRMTGFRLEGARWLPDGELTAP